MSSQPAPSSPGNLQSADNSYTAAHPPSSGPDPTTALTDGSKGGVTAADTASAAKLASAKVVRLKGALKQYPDFPSKGILFEDILPIFADPSLHEDLITALKIQIEQKYETPDIIVGLEARGFLFGPSLALRLGAGFVPVRKQGKLPGECVTASYEKEYGADFFQIQQGAIRQGQKVLIVDDIIATGGSAAAASSLVKQAGGQLLGFVFMLELDFLKGRAKLDAPVYTLLSSQEKS